MVSTATRSAPHSVGVALAETVDRVQARYAMDAIRIGRPPEDGWLSPRELVANDSPHLARLLTRVGVALETPRRDVAASFFFGTYGWLLAVAGVGAYLVDRRVPSLAPDEVLVRFDDDGYPAGVALLGGRLALLPDDPAAADPAATVVADTAALRAVVRAEMEAHLTPMVAAVRAIAPLGARALWLLVADGCAWCVAHHADGARDGEVGERDADWARAEIAALTQGPPWRGRAGVLELEAAGRRRLFPNRGGCCLSHKLPAAEYCATCPLVSPDEQRRRLQAHLAEEHA